MATEESKFRIIVLLNCLAFAFTSATPLSIPLGSVSDLLIQSALDSLNENAQTHHTYKSGNLISAQKLEQPPYKVYKLTLNLEPNCNEESPCPREACAIDLRQHELGVIDVQRNSIQCMYLYPQSVQTDMQQQQPIQDGLREISNTQDQETTESLDKHLINDSVQLDHEVQTVTDGIERPFIAVRATDRNYCAGCPYELNPTLPGLGAFGEEVVRSMDDTGRSDFKHKVISIVRVTRAVPPGSNVILYELLLEIGESNCPRTATIERNECSLIANVPVQLCLVTFEQRPWQHESRKIIRNNCTDFPESYNEIDTSFADSRATRQTLGTIEAEVPSTENVVSRINEQTSGDTNNGEKTLISYSSTIDEYFNNPVESTSSSATSIDDKTRIPVNEEASKKIVIHKEEDEKSKKTVGFKNKFKEFDDFLDDFDLPIKARDPAPVDPRKPVNEEIIVPEKIARPEKTNEPSCVNSNGEDAKRSIRSIFDYTKEERILIEKLAQKAVDELDEIDPDDKKRVLLGVLDSKKQPGNDTIYYITMKVATSNCLEGTKRCNDDWREPVKICKAQIYVAAEKSLKGAKILQSQCFDEIKRRETRVRRHIVGAAAQRKVDDPEIQEYVAKGLSKYSETLNAEREPFLVEIVEATAQIVAGTLYKIKVRLGESTCPKSVKENCQLREGSQVDNYLITVLSQPWVDNDKPEITIEHLKEKNTSRSRRSSRRLGGATSVSPDDPEIRAYAEKGLNKHSESLGAEKQPFLVKILEATSQIVSGKLYKIKVQFGESTCPKGVTENCQLKEGSQVDDYLISVWSQPWIDHGNPEITVEPLKKNNPDRLRRASGMPGGTTPMSPDDPEIRAYAEKGLNKHSESLGAERQPFLVRIVEATSQIVSGKLYKIKVQFGESTCPKGVKENCQLKEGSQVDDYLISVWSQPWVDHGNPEITVERWSDKKISKRSLKGQSYTEKMLRLYKDIENERAFDRFINEHEKTYVSEDEKKYRFGVFLKNMKIVEELRRTEEGTGIYGATIFADLTPEEFRSRHLGLNPKLRSDNDIPLPMAEIPDIELPKEFDWRHSNVVTAVKNQGSCGSCWAFAVTGNIEGLNAIKHGKLISLSEQELVDCDKLDQGCNGGLPDSAYRAIEELGGLELETDYPYDGANEKCHFDKSKARVNVVSGVNITSNETQMAQWLVQNGPIAIGINANAMQFYMGGISHPYKFLCNPKNLDHGVLIVGYGIHTYPIFKKSMPYWIIKNSWGPRWGEQGYYRVYRGDGTCGLNQMASSAVIA